MDGHGAAVGGVIIDSGKFDWMAHEEKSLGLCTLDESYHGIIYAEKFEKEGAIITKCTSQIMRNLGSIQSPPNIRFAPFTTFKILEGVHEQIIQLFTVCSCPLFLGNIK